MTKKVSAADQLVLAEIYRRLDWIDTTSETCVEQVQRMVKEGLIEQFSFSGLRLKINGTWYDRP